jgi:hypothetical protein
MRKYIKAFLLAILFLTCGCNSIDFNFDDAKVMKEFFESKGLKNVTIDREDSSFYRMDGKLKAKVVVRFDFVDIYKPKGEKSNGN